MTQPAESRTLEVRRDEWSTTRVLHEALDTNLAEGDVLLRVDRQALTANNISYAFSGDLLGYWGFFPTEAGWGRIPAMGYADVQASEHPDIEVGERVWGFFPMSTHLRIKAGRVNPQAFVDVSEHRSEYAPVYAQYQRASGNPIYEPAREDQDSLLRGLFLTSWLCEDYIHDNGNFGADACLVTSASSKTSIALGHTLSQRGELRPIGLTSAGNRSFCEQLGCYDTVVTYDEVGQLDAGEAVVMVDMAGSADLTLQLHTHYGDNMRFSSKVGATHYEEAGGGDGLLEGDAGLPGAKPEFFFAPSQAQKRASDWGPGEIEQRMGASFVAFRKFCDNWLQVERHYGAEAVQAAYQAVLAGRQPPQNGCIISLWDSAE